ncbi:MAG: redox-regulated ATPase YchF [Anaerolineales bacterium]
MKLGIVGFSQAGKTTLFNALTRGNQPTTMSGARFEVHTAVVDVPDPRVTLLSEMFHPQKTTCAKVTYEDIAGLESGSQQGFSGPLLNQLSQMDGFIHVVRCFDNPSVPHPFGEINPRRDLEALDAEFLLNDLILVERKQERLQDELRKGGGRKKEVIQEEITLFEKLHATLSEEKPLRTLEFSAEEEKIMSGFGFLTRKPVLVVFNLADEQTPPEISYPWPHSALIALQGRLEMELAQLSPDEAEIFMQEYGVEELSLSKVIRLSYDLLGLQSFFTVGEDEVRAWTVRRGANAVEAAGAIHSDLAKGFIRAEVIAYDDLIALGSMAEARKQGKLRLEGKEYIVLDGDILHIRFNV